jgi:hypothetical protein
MTDADQGHLGALTPPGADPGDVDEAADLLDVAGLPDVLSLDVLGATAELVASERRARGRPKGSANKRNTDMLRYLQSLGHRDPLVTLSMIQTADTKTLARTLCADAIDVLRVQAQAANSMLPYLYARKPQQLELPPGDARPVMVIGEMNVQQVTNVAMMSAGEAPKQYQALSGEEAVRDRTTPSHDEE